MNGIINGIDADDQITHNVRVSSSDFDPDLTNNEVIEITTICMDCPDEIFIDQFE